jgi:hypothetical protein
MHLLYTVIDTTEGTALFVSSLARPLSSQHGFGWGVAVLLPQTRPSPSPFRETFDDFCGTRYEALYRAFFLS